MQVALKRWYRAYHMVDMSAAEAKPAGTVIEFRYQSQDKAQDDAQCPIWAAAKRGARRVGGLTASQAALGRCAVRAS